MQSTVMREPCLQCRVPAKACQLRRSMQRARHRFETWVSVSKRVEGALGTPAMLRSASVNGKATAEAAGALGLQSTMMSREGRACAVPCACDGVPAAALGATRPPLRGDVTGRLRARRARSRHACIAVQCVRQREGNGRGGGCTRPAVDGDARAVPAVPCACDDVPTATLGATRPPSLRDATGRQQGRRAPTRHACHALECVRQQEGNGRGGAGALGLQSTVTGEPCLRCRVPAMACQLRRLMQRARHRGET